MADGLKIIGTSDSDLIFGFVFDDTIFGRAGDDWIDGRGGSDNLKGESGFDNLSGGDGNDYLRGGSQNDNLHGGAGNDRLSGDNADATAKGNDRGSDNLNGGAGNDRLIQGDGNDFMTGGAGRDTFAFKWMDPTIALAAGTGPAFTTLTDFNPDQDRLTFDVAGVGNDAPGANFTDGGAGDGTPGGRASSFFTGAAASSNGQSVMILTDQAFATGIDAVTVARNEAVGDLIVYFNTTVGAASLLHVDGTNMAHSIARFTNIDELADLQNANFTAADFIFV